MIPRQIEEEKKGGQVAQQHIAQIRPAGNAKKYEFVLPNQVKFNDGFWKQDMVNLFMSENYGQNDPNYKDNLRVAILVQ